jgi:hypothetical protein
MMLFFMNAPCVIGLNFRERLACIVRMPASASAASSHYCGGRDAARMRGMPSHRARFRKRHAQGQRHPGNARKYSDLANRARRGNANAPQTALFESGSAQAGVAQKFITATHAALVRFGPRARFAPARAAGGAMLGRRKEEEG